MAEFVLPHKLCGNTNEKRETAGSLATLGMTTRKARARSNRRLSDFGTVLLCTQAKDRDFLRIQPVPSFCQRNVNPKSLY